MPDDPEPLAPLVLPLLDTELDLPVDVPVLLVAACDDPGSTAATTPAVITLATDTVAVTAFSLRRPLSRSATARARWRREAEGRHPACPRVDPFLPSTSSQLFMSTTVP